MSTSKLKLNPEKTEFIIFGSKFPFDILGGPLCAAESVKNLGVCPNMFRTSAKVALYNSMTLDMSESFLLYILLSMLLSQNKGINSPIESIKTWVCGLILICSFQTYFFQTYSESLQKLFDATQGLQFFYVQSM